MSKKGTSVQDDMSSYEPRTVRRDGAVVHFTGNRGQVARSLSELAGILPQPITEVNPTADSLRRSASVRV